MEKLLWEWGRGLKEQRLIWGMSQADLAKALDVSQGAVSRWEKGHAGPSDWHKRKIAFVFKVPARTLFPLPPLEDAA